MTLTGDRVQAGRSFATSGTKLALAVFVGGIKGLIFFAAIRGYPAEVSTAYGTSLTVMLAVMMLGVGLNVLVVQQLTKKVAEGRLREEGKGSLRDIAGAALVSTAVLLAVLIVAGIAISILDSTGMTAIAYWSRVPTLICIPIENVIAGLLVVQGKEGTQLRTTLENLGLTLLSAIVLQWFELSTAGILFGIGVAGITIDLFTTARQWIRLGPLRRDLIEAIRNAVPAVTKEPKPHIRTMFIAVTGASDGLIIMGSFAVIATLASRISPEAGAITATLISVIRTLVVPLKQYGIVAGRLTKAAGTSTALHPSNRMRLFISMIAAVMIPVGLVCIFLPHLIASAVGITDPSMAALLVVRIAGVQLIIEPMAGFASAALKILTVPSAAMRPLIIAMFGIALPVMAILFISGYLTLPAIWLVLLVARLVFCAQVIRLYVSWERSFRTANAV